MSGLSTIRSIRRHAARSRRRPAFRGRLESLENRLVMAGDANLILDIATAGASEPNQFVQVGAWLYFTAEDIENGRELWRTDGTAAGTAMVKDIHPGPDGSYPGDLTEFNGMLVFSASDELDNIELWKSDGTADGTVMIRDIANTGFYSSNPRDLITNQNTLYFTAVSPGAGREVWRTDGTENGTQQVADVNSALGVGSSPRALTVSGNRLYFAADDSTGDALWQSDGTAGGTVLVKHVHIIGGYGYSSQPMTDINGQLFFPATDDNDQAQLWTSNGTAAGTFPIFLADPESGGASMPSNFTSFNGSLLFTATDADHGEELWRSNGTQAGTVRVADIVSEPEVGSYPRHLTVVGNQVFFAASQDDTGEELWVTDGTTAGTMLVKDIETAPNQGSYPYRLTAVGGKVYFSARTNSFGSELWESDGTAAGTKITKDIAVGPADSSPEDLIGFGTKVVFAADDGEHGVEPWIYDPNATPIEEPGFTFDFTTIASDLHPSFRFFGSPNPNHAPFQIIRYGLATVTSLVAFPETAALVSQPNDITIEFGSTNTSSPVAVVTLQEFDSGTIDGIANQIYRPVAGNVPQVTLSISGTPVAVGVLQELALETTPAGDVRSIQSRLQFIAPVGADTTVYDEILSVTDGTGLIPFHLTPFFLVGPWAGVSDAEIFDSSGGSAFQNVKRTAIDFSKNLTADLDDIDAVSAAILANSNDRRFDLNRDQLINRDDIVTWLTWAGELKLPTNAPYLAADLNLDGVVDAQDLDTWSANQFTVTNRWSEGDLNTDGQVDASDFNIWLNHRFMTSVPGVAAMTRLPRAAQSQKSQASTNTAAYLVDHIPTARHSIEGQSESVACVLEGKEPVRSGEIAGTSKVDYSNFSQSAVARAPQTLRRTSQRRDIETRRNGSTDDILDRIDAVFAEL